MPESQDYRTQCLSVVLPAYNEASCLEGTVRELVGVLDSSGHEWEIVVVDDGSTDRTPGILRNLAESISGLRWIRLKKNSGQSAAMVAGFRESRGDAIVTMDSDGQNDPADIPRLVSELDGCDCCCGYRASRQDTASKRLASRLANVVRNAVLGENIIDTGCSLKAFKAELVRELNVWDGMHRFFPTLFMMKGARIKQIPVRHRPRQGGRSKYTNWGRLWRTIRDLRGVLWLKARSRPFKVRDEHLEGKAGRQP